MKVILNQTVPKVGKEGAIVTVADGFARNYLFPRGLAIAAEKNQIKALEKRNERVAAKVAALKADAEVLKEKLQGASIRIEGKVGQAQGKLFGAITNADVATAIESQLKISLDKKQVALVDPIRRLGTHSVELDLHREVTAHITVTVFDPNAPVAAEPAAEEVSDDTEESAEPALA